MTETRDNRLRRLRMRSMRRGIKEMDIILSRYSEVRLESLSDEDVAIYDALLSENDQDLYQWVTGQQAPPARFKGVIADVIRTAFGSDNGQKIT